MTDFSSRGPNMLCPLVLKPDITAPGVSILASYTEAHPVSLSPFEAQRSPFALMSGTSMACPHVAGVIGLLRKLYLNWSPAAISSAIMTKVLVAITHDNTGKPMRCPYVGQSGPFEYGSGHIQPNRAMNPGLVYDMDIKDYVDFVCSFVFNASQMERFIGKRYECPSEQMVVENLNNPPFAILLHKTKDLDTTEMLGQLPALQQLLIHLLNCQLHGAALYNLVIRLALTMVAAESTKIYGAITIAIINLVDKFFEMPRHDAVKALEIYRRAVQ